MAVETRRLRSAREDDLPRIAKIHLQAYSTSHFTSRLPSAVLERYYRLFLGDGAETLLLVAADDAGNEAILGFAVFGRHIGEKIVRFKRENSRAVLAAAIRHPVAAAGKAFRQLWTKVSGGRPMASADHLLLSIAAACPGTGAGSALLKAFLERSAELGAERVGLYVNADNLVAINAYVGQGFAFRQLRGDQYYMERVLQRRATAPEAATDTSPAGAESSPPSTDR